MDLSKVKEKLNNLTQKGYSSGPKKDYTKIFWKPSLGKQVIRVVPSKVNKDFPFYEMLFHYNIGKLKLISSPINWGEKDPIMEFVKELKKSDDRENWLLAKKLSAKKRYFVPVIVRGEEDKGVRLWQFGKLIYQDFLNLADDKEVGDYSDVLQGRDIKLTTVGPDVTGTDYNKTTISPSLSTSPLSEDKDKVELWLKEQPVPTEEYNKFTFDEIKNALRDHLSSGEEEAEGDIIDEGKMEFDGEKSYTSPKVFPSKDDKDDEFDKLFEDDK